MSDTNSYVVVIHATVHGREMATRVRTEVAEAYADSLRAEDFVDPTSVRVLEINPVSKARLARVAA